MQVCRRPAESRAQGAGGGGAGQDTGIAPGGLPGRGQAAVSLSPEPQRHQHVRKCPERHSGVQHRAKRFRIGIRWVFHSRYGYICGGELVTSDACALLVCRTAVLRKLGHIDAAGLVQLKGKAACEVRRELPSDSKQCALVFRQCYGAAP
jgi:hypothetical protein